MTKLRSISPWEWIALLVVLGLAAVLRFGWAGINSFAFDEARLSLLALSLARGGVLPTVGMPSSAGVPNLPASVWVFAPPYFLSTDPLIATWYVGLLGLGTIVLLWALARHAWGPWPALVAAIYMAASPYSVLYSRSIWAQNLLPFLSVLWAVAAYVAIIDGRRWAIALHVFIAGFAFQVHFAGLPLILGTAYLLFRFTLWRQTWAVLAGAALAALALLPFLISLARDPALAEQYGAILSQPIVSDISVFDSVARLALGVRWSFLAAGETGTIADTPAVSLVVWVLLTLGMVVVVREWVQPQGQGRAAVPVAKGNVTLSSATASEAPHGLERLLPDRPNIPARILDEMVIVWVLVTPIFFIRHSTPVHLHYLLPSLPAFALVVASCVRFTPTRSWMAGVTLVMSLVGIAWAVQLRDALTLAGQVETPNGLGTPLQVVRSAAYGPPAVLPTLLFTHGDDPAVDGEAAVFETLWWGRPHRIIQGESLVILPDRPATLMATLAPFQAWEELEASGLAERVQTYERRIGAMPYVATLYDGVQAPEGFTEVDPVPFADGAVLEGWRVRWVGPRLRVSTLWRVVAPPPAGTFQQFHHLHTEATLDGEARQISDVPLSVHDWQVGDRLIVMADFFNVQPGTYWIDIGHYGLPDVTRVPREDDEGDFVRLGPIDVNAPPIQSPDR